jgi:site-specific recombinase XerD
MKRPSSRQRSRSGQRNSRRSQVARNWLVTPDKFLCTEQVATLRAKVEEARQRGLTAGDKIAVRNSALVEVLLGTGLRVSELCGLTIGDIYLRSGRADVVVRHGKGDKARIVAISHSLAGYLTELLAWKATVGEHVEPRQPVFVSERGSFLTRSAVHRIWKTTLKSAGLPETWGVHATRHSYAVEVYRKTHDLRLTQRLLGHSNISTTTVYASLLDEDIRQGVERLWAA